ncbi:MAG: hypothetical protein WCQ47_00490 [bacterium]
MKKLYYNLINGRIFGSFLFCYIILFLVGALNKLIMFSLGRGDSFFTVFKAVTSGIGLSDSVLNSLASYVMFLGSFYGVIIFPIFQIVSITLYAVIIQMLLHLFMKEPKRFSVTLNIFYTVLAFLSVLTIIPYIGSIISGVLFLYMAAKELAEKNSFSTNRGILLLIAPSMLMFILCLGFLFSIFKMISFF